MPNIITHTLFAQEIFDKVNENTHDLFAKDTPNKGKGTKKEPGYFCGFKKDIWQAMAVAYVFHTKYIGTEC